MAVGLISKKYLIDCANAIRVMLGTESTYTPAQMATAIADITGSLSGEITKSSNTDIGLITDSLLEDICDALRTKLDDQTLTFTPSQIADAILTIQASSSVPDVVSFANGTDQQIAAMIDYAHSNTSFDLHTDGGWNIGDTRTINIAAFSGRVSHAAQEMDIVITSFDEYEGCGNVMQFDFKSSLAEKEALGSVYANSQVKSVTLPALVEALPSWLNSRLIEFDCYANASGSNTATKIEGNKLALRSSVEVCDETYTALNQGVYLSEYYNSSNRRTKKLGKTGSGYGWWTRSSPNGSGYNSYGHVMNQYGSRSSEARSNEYGISPFGCL